MSHVRRTTDETAEYKVPSAVPQSKSITEEFFPAELNARNVTKTPAPSEPRKAQKLTGEIRVKNFEERVAVPKERTVLAITAPKVAPELIPIIPGSASGFLKKS